MSDTTLGARLDEARTAMNLSRAQLATHMGVMTKTIKNWETDRSEPRSNKLVTLAGMLGVSVIWLATGAETEGNMPKANRAETTNISLKMERLYALHDQMSILMIEVQNEIDLLQSRLDNA